MNVLITGNSAKLYCINWIASQIQDSKLPVTMLDMGCGTAHNIVLLLKAYPHLHYTGLEPHGASFRQAQQNLFGLNATAIQTNGYRVYQKLGKKFDFILSFSTFEHVYNRPEYMRSAKECLNSNGRFLINYDAGHFISGGFKDKMKTLIGPVLARFGVERYYQSFVKEETFLALTRQVGLKIVESKMFNGHLFKGFYKLIPESGRADFMRKWLDFELWANELGLPYDDSQAKLFGTRNFILSHP